MEDKNLDLLIVDDEERIRSEIKDFFDGKPYNIFEAEIPSKAFSILKESEIDIIILDIKMPEMNGIEVLKKVKLEYPDIEVIMITGHGDENTMEEALKYGAFDFFNKPISLTDVKNSIERTTKYINLSDKYRRLQDNFYLITKDDKISVGSIIGKSSAIKDVISLTLKAASTPDTSVLITGESGSGKELIAKALHYASSRAKGVFYPVNCSAIPDTLIESEFFGHIKGSFTGAIEDKMGVFEAANGGTVFLDEIGDMPLNAQAKLLWVLEERKIKRIGSNKEIDINVRVIAATNKNLLENIEKKEFRSDLYYRLNSVEIKVPSLRERKEDISLLVEYFIDFYSKKFKKNVNKIDNDVLNLLLNYDFPGNIRELDNMIERAIIISDNSNLLPSDFPIKKDSTLLSFPTDPEILDNLDLNIIDEFEVRYIKEALKRSNNKKIKAAELLKISRFALDRRLEKYNIKV